MRFAVAVLLIFFCAAARAQTSQPASSDLEARLTRIDQRAARVKSIQASFRQEKYTAMLKDPLISTGTVRAAQSRVRWDTQSPQPSVLYADATELRLYYPSEKSEEIYPIDRRLADLLSSPLPRLPVIRENFQIQIADPADLPKIASATLPTELCLRLLPTSASIKQHVKEVIVLLNESTGLADAVQTTDPDGDRTLIIFTDVKFNADLKESDLNLAVPSGTAISRPLQSNEPPR